MPKKKWSELNHLQLGKYAEYYAKMEFTSYGYDVYTSEVDDHGVDFVARDKTGNYIEVQVRSHSSLREQFGAISLTESSLGIRAVDRGSSHLNR